MTKAIRLANGSRLNHGQIINPRGGAPKNIGADIPVKPGMRSRIAPSHAFLHGAPIDDEPLQKTYERGIPLHSANPLSPDKAAKHATAASDHLISAANLGRKR
jgi:hypothetical protein